MSNANLAVKTINGLHAVFYLEGNEIKEIAGIEYTDNFNDVRGKIFCYGTSLGGVLSEAARLPIKYDLVIKFYDNNGNVVGVMEFRGLRFQSLKGSLWSDSASMDEVYEFTANRVKKVCLKPEEEKA